MARNIRIYSHPFYLHNHEYAKIYHKAKLVIKEDDKYDLSKDKIEKFCMELGLAGQTFYWGEFMTIPSQKIQAAVQPMLRVPVLNTEEIHLLHNGLSITTEQVNNWSK